MKSEPPIELRYRRLIEISRDLASTLDLDTLLSRIVQAAVDISQAEAASILLYDDIRQQLYFEVTTNLELPTLGRVVVPIESSIAGWVLTNRQALTIPNVEKDSRHFTSIDKATNIKTKSLIGVPMIAKDKIVGVLEAINRQNGKFSQEDQDLLTILGTQAAVAIENARLFLQSDLISELVHELRTPLSSMSTASHLLLHPDISKHEQKHMIEIIQGEVTRLSDLATAFLDLSRLESGRAQFKTEEFDLNALLEECVALMHSRAEEKGLALTVNIPPRPLKMKADRDKIKQVALNLLSNAIKYNRSHGNITVSARLGQEELSFSVADTGVGIRPENMAHLFEKFYRAPGAEAQASGTGLGLSICRRIVEAHRGHIEVHSELGVGTEFTVRLPKGL